MPVRRTFVQLSLILLASACVASGPVRVAPEGARFDGIRDVFEERDESGQRVVAHLNVFIVHGMRASAPQFVDDGGDCSDTESSPRQESDEAAAIEADVRREVVGRLALDPTPIRRCTIILMRDAMPDVRIAGRPVWSELDEWRRDAPFLEVAEHEASDGRLVRFYGFNYWGMLVRIKCAELVMLDSALVGESDASRFCAARYGSEALERLSSEPLSINRMLKADLVTWGFADAILASSDLERIIRTALRQAMLVQLQDATRSRNGNAAAPPLPQVNEDVPAFLASVADQRWVVVTKSLGSWLTLGALTSESDYRAPGQTTALDRRLDSAAFATICGSNQIHMLANQVALLRLSEITVREGNEAPEPPSDAAARDPALNLQRVCQEGSLRPLQVVAYHDPNDLLTFMLPEPRAGVQGALEPGTRSVSFTNVVAPFAPVIVPFFVANPAEAHDGQKLNPRIMNMVVDGWSPPS